MTDPFMDLRAMTTIAAQEVDASGTGLFTLAQQKAVVNNPNLYGAYRGSTIDRIVRNRVDSDPLLEFLEGKPNKGPDFIEPKTGQWWDMTTPGQWPAHVTKYGPDGIFVPTRR